MNTLNKSVGDTITIKHSVQEKIFAIISTIDEGMGNRFSRTYFINAYDFISKKNMSLFLFVFKKPALGGMMVGKMRFMEHGMVFGFDVDVWEIK